MSGSSESEKGASTAPQKSPAELGLEIYNILSPYPADVRQRAVQAALVALGEVLLPQRNLGAGTGAQQVDVTSEFGDLQLGPKALRWAQKHGLTRTMFDEVFHFTNGGVDVIATEVPGASKREMTVNCYLLLGARGLLKGDVPSLDDNDAIALCKRLAVYDKNNHTTNRLAVGNKMTGTKPAFALTGPGEAAAADLIKQMANSKSV